MSSDLILSARGLGKAYHIYKRPQDRLLQMLFRGRRQFFDEFWALRNIDLDIYRGETVGVIGRNGAGKSTLLQLLCGTLTPTEGTCRIDGRVAALLELGTGFNPEFTGRENVYLNAAVLGLKQDEIDAKFGAIEAFADIGDFIDQPVKTYSSGMHARLAFAVAIHVDPEVLIVDEILAVGDVAFQRKCIERFYQIRDSGCTILFVSHDPYMVKTVCQRAIYLSHGQPVAYGPAAEVIDRYTVDMEAANKPATPPPAPEPEPAPAETANADEEPPEEKPAPESVPKTTKPVDRTSAATPYENAEALFRITDVRLENGAGEETDEIGTGDDIQIRMQYRALVERLPALVSYVVNLYRHDDFYICGTTTLMEGLAPFKPARNGEVLIRFPRFQLLAGEYKWRVAINDDRGLIIFAEARPVCPFRVRDDFRSVGLVDLPREWYVRDLDKTQASQQPETTEAKR